MDRETLSNYGWITIVTLVLAVMLALATPFGTYVGDGVVSIARGYVDTSEKKLNNDNVKEMGSKWDGKFENGVSNNANILVGDVNEDGAINMFDPGVLQQYLSGSSVTINLINADCNGDGQITQDDLTILTNYLNGYEEARQTIKQTQNKYN